MTKDQLIKLVQRETQMISLLELENNRLEWLLKNGDLERFGDPVLVKLDFEKTILKNAAQIEVHLQYVFFYEKNLHNIQ